MYFDTLPREVLPTIIKHLFAVIELEDTPAGELDTLTKRRMRIHALHVLVSDSSPFREVLSQWFLTKLQLGMRLDLSSLWNDGGRFVIGPELFEIESLELGLPERIFRLIGASAKIVSFLIDWEDLPPRKTDDNVVIQRFMTLVKIHCTNIEGLELEAYKLEEALQLETGVEWLLEKFSSKLQSIIWWTFHVRNSHTVVLDISLCTHIRELTFPFSPQLISFFHTFASSLESLTVPSGGIDKYVDGYIDGYLDGYVEMFDLIVNNCTNLSTVSLMCYLRIVESVGEELYANFLCCFGSKLIHAEIEELSVGKLAQIVRACPNLLIRGSFEVDQAGEWERVNILGSMIKNLTVAAEMCRDEKCEQAIAKCTNLESLTISASYADDEVDFYDYSDMVFLSSISSSSLNRFCHFDFIPTQPNVDILSSTLSNLYSLNLYFSKPMENGIDLKSITKSSPQLKSLFIQEFGDNFEERGKDLLLEILRMLVNTFSKCRSIRLILIDGEEEGVTRDEIHDICSTLPCRGVDLKIQVSDVCYQQTSSLADSLIQWWFDV